MDATCITYGFLISIVVTMAKRIPFVAKYPKIVATIISSAVVVWQTFAHGGAAATAAQVAAIATCITTQLGGSVLMYEAVSAPLYDKLTAKLAQTPPSV